MAKEKFNIFDDDDDEEKETLAETKDAQAETETDDANQDEPTSAIEEFLESLKIKTNEADDYAEETDKELTDSAEYDPQPNEAELSPEEEIEIKTILAEEHLNNLNHEQNDNPALEDFLSKVSDGQDDRQAFEEVINDHQLNAEARDFQPEDISLNDSQANAETGQSSTAEDLNTDHETLSNSHEPIMTNSDTEQVFEVNHEASDNNDTTNSNSANFYYPRPSSGDNNFNFTQPQTSAIRAETTNTGAGLALGAATALGYLINRSKKAVSNHNQKKQIANYKKQIDRLEQQLVVREQVIVSLYNQHKTKTQNPNYYSKNNPQRIQPESRLQLSKPARILEIGRVGVTKELQTKPETVIKLEKPNSIRDYYRAEDIRDLKQSEVLEIATKIKLLGASLAETFRAHLISEKSLRLLIAHYLMGKDIVNELKKAMIEKQIDYERDPVLRDKHLKQSGILDEEIFDRMLLSSNVVADLLPRNTHQTLNQQNILDSKTKNSKKTSKPQKITPINSLGTANQPLVKSRSNQSNKQSKSSARKLLLINILVIAILVAVVIVLLVK